MLKTGGDDYVGFRVLKVIADGLVIDKSDLPVVFRSKVYGQEVPGPIIRYDENSSRNAGAGRLHLFDMSLKRPNRMIFVSTVRRAEQRDPIISCPPIIFKRLIDFPSAAGQDQEASEIIGEAR